MFYFSLLLGIVAIAVGIYAIKNPYSWWFKRIGDDRDPSEARILYVKFAGKAVIMLGVIIIILGVQHLS
ncbi:hypothetical protein DMN77_22740 [Paenibacillus sp. 79R4]|nr:hypothetical protein [Paenibacillus sp. 79R4]